MAISDPASVLAALRNLTSIEAQVAAFRTIRNSIIGHELRKIDYVRAGLVSIIAELLRHLQTSLESKSQAIDQEDQLWQQTTNITTSIAHAGPSFVQPILNSSIPTSLLARLLSEPPPKLALAILRCFNVLTENLPLSSPDDWTPDKRIANLLCDTKTTTRLVHYVSRADSSSVLSQEICDATLALVCKSCTDEKQKALLVKADLTSVLAQRLASFVVSEGLVIPGLDAHGVDFRERGTIPKPAPRTAQLSPVLETLSLLVDGSKTNATQLLEHPALISILPPASEEFLPSDVKRSPWGGTYLSGGAVPRSQARTLLDSLLPNIPNLDKPESGESFPPLGTVPISSKRRSSSIRPASEAPSAPAIDDTNTYEEKTLLVPWLLYTAHTCRGKISFLACQLLVNLFNHSLIQSNRISTLKTLVTPALVQFLDIKQYDDETNAQYLLTRMSFSRVVPSVLARLIMDDQKLQKVAADGKAITKLVACLKNTFEPPNEKAALWRPTKRSSESLHASSDCNLGPGGPTLEQRHVMYYREGLLQALAAIAAFNDQYRKEICDQGVLTQIMLALEPFHSDASVEDSENFALTSTGNSASTLLAACDAVRALTRSVTALRTKLVDADIGKAIVRLLHSSDPEVRITATKVVANLATDFSPMKSTISEPALVKKLCEQAHSASARLRLESIWALKHLVFRSDNKLKKDVIDELGATWIKQLIASDPYSSSSAEAAGLGAKDDQSGTTQSADSHDVIMGDGCDPNELTNVKHTVEDALAIQEQLLDLLRNLFCGENASEVIDYVLGEMGERDFMQILMDRLKSRTTVGATRRSTQTIQAPVGIVSSTLFIVVHLAACTPKFRTMLTNDQALMRQILIFQHHQDVNIRAAICWIAINLTYGDSAADREQCRIRALDMNRVGWLVSMRLMAQDPELNIRERAKTATNQMEKLLPFA